MSKILFTASTWSHILHFHLPYLQYFEQQGWTVHAACGGAPAFVPHAAEMIPLPLEKSMTSPGNLRAAAILRNRIAREGYDLITTHTSLAAFFTRLAVKGLRKRPPLVNMVHGYLFDDQTPYIKRRLLLAAEQWTAPETDLLLTMNRWDYELAANLRLGGRVAEVPGIGVDFSRFSRLPARDAARNTLCLPQDAFVLLYAAEFSKRKSQQVLLHAIRGLPDRVILVLAGSGTEQPACERLAADLGLQGRVLFPGYQQEMPVWYAAADAVAAASRSEGLPFHVMEAMYAGLPVIASAVKGHTDLIEEGKTGLLYPYGDSAACAAQLQRLLDMPSLRAALSGAAKESVGRFALDAVFPQVLAQYCSLLPVHTDGEGKSGVMEGAV